jgi:hypothetical protein
MNSSRLYQKICKLADRANATRVDLGESLIVNGFWRSGTTWIMESAATLLDAKVVFEPFNSPNPKFTPVSQSPIGQCISAMGLPRTDHAFVRAMMPYLATPFDPESQLGQLVGKSLHGVHPYRSSLNIDGWAKKRLGECLRPRVVTKFTRGALCLRPIQDHFGMPILHVIRDPRSAVASLKKTQGGNLGWGTFNDFPLQNLLLGIQDGRADYFSQWETEIRQFSQEDDFCRLAAYYCLTEKYFQESFQTAQHPFQVIQYEAVVEGGTPVLQRALEALGLPVEVQESVDLSRSSTTDWNQTQAAKASPRDRIFALRNQLTPQQQRTIEEVVADFGMEDHLWEVASPSLMPCR